MPLNLKSLNRRQKYISSVSRVEGKSNAPPPLPPRSHTRISTHPNSRVQTVVSRAFHALSVCENLTSFPLRRRRRRRHGTKYLLDCEKTCCSKQKAETTQKEGRDTGHRKGRTGTKGRGTSELQNSDHDALMDSPTYLNQPRV